MLLFVFIIITLALIFCRQLQAELQQLASDVAESASEIVTAAPSPAKLGPEAKYFGEKTSQLIVTGSQLAHLHEETDVREEIFITLKNVHIVSSNLLVVAKSVSLNPDAPGARNQLTAAARYFEKTCSFRVEWFK